MRLFKLIWRFEMSVYYYYYYYYRETEAHDCYIHAATVGVSSHGGIRMTIIIKLNFICSMTIQ